MTKADFIDSVYLLELNLLKIKRELILMIEEFEKQDCLVCLQLKCRCGKATDEGSGLNRSQDDSGHESNEGTPRKAPSADTLPKPKFDKEAINDLTASVGKAKDIEAWMEASIITQNDKTLSNDRRISTDVVASLKNYWADRSDLSKERILEDLKKETVTLDGRFTANAVDLFFKTFKLQPANATHVNIALINKMASSYVQKKSRSSEYSYF